MTCDQSDQVQAYYDGELPAERRAVVEAHLRQCEPCRVQLAQLRGLSGLLQSAPLRALPAGAMQRLDQAWEAVQERAVLRISSWLTAAAAAVLIGALIWIPMQNRHASELASSQREPDVWQTVAVMPAPEQREESGDQGIVLAQWMADELSVR